MAKRFLAVCVIILAMISVAACSSSGECDICEERGSLTRVDVMGEGRMDLCDDCAEAMEELNEMFRDLAGILD